MPELPDGQEDIDEFLMKVPVEETLLSQLFTQFEADMSVAKQVTLFREVQFRNI